MLNFFGGSAKVTENLSHSGSKVSNDLAQDEPFSQKREIYMENIRRKAREDVVKQRRQQPNMFKKKDNDVNEGSDADQYSHLPDNGNKDELVKKLIEFNEVNVDDFEDSQLDEIANTLKNGNM